MQFLLHIGTEKTGSSFLQTLSALGRDDLYRQRVWFPRGTRYDERCMTAGRISAGNGRRFAIWIEQGDWDAVTTHVRATKDEASAKGCAAMMVSSEQLLVPLSAPETLAKFNDILTKLDFEGLKLLMILRNPAEQFLSLYKHRAKSGKAGTITAWAETGYDLPQRLAELRRGVSDVGIDLTVRKYERGEGALEKVYFTDWLGAIPPKVTLQASVNPSLALSELALLRLLADRRPELVAPLYEYLLCLDLSEKAQGEALEAHAKAVANEAVSKYADEWRAWNALLPEDEELVIPSPLTEIPPEPRELGFSEIQMAELMAFMSESLTPRFIVQQFWTSRLRPILGRAKRAVIGSDLQ
jgi:hypothetical protein